MSQTAGLAASATLTTKCSPCVGAGTDTRLYVGHAGGQLYSSFLKFVLDWTNVGTITSAVLTLHTDDGLGAVPLVLTDTPKFWVQRLTSAFTPGTHAEWDAADYQGSAVTLTTSEAVSFTASNAPNSAQFIDITGIVRQWAPNTVAGGLGQANHGIKLVGYNLTDDQQNWTGWSKNATDPNMRPYITLTYEYGATTPNVPTSLTPSITTIELPLIFEGAFTDISPTAILKASEVIVDEGATRLWTYSKTASESEIAAARYHLDATGRWTPQIGHTYTWKTRVQNSFGNWSAYTAANTMQLYDALPVATLTSPANAISKASLDGVLFKVSYSHPNGHSMRGYRLQLASDAGFTNIFWDTNRIDTPSGATTGTKPYGGLPLAAGTYYWRAVVFDEQDTASAWTSGQSITLTAGFDVLPGNTTTVQERERVPWRIVIKAMHTNGLRGPGVTVAILEHAKSVGASLAYNSPGEAHWTLPFDDPQLSVIEPKQTHYSIQFYTGDGWREVFAGLVWDIDATERDVVFYGIDYLALFDYVLDERYDPTNPNKAAESGGSFYVTTGMNTIGYIVNDQLSRAVNTTTYPNSPVGFITVGTIDPMTETASIYSTYAPTLTFVTALLDSHRAGSGNRTRIAVRQKFSGGYEVYVQDDPGITRDNLRLQYGELVQGYRVIFFGKQWASRIAGIGRDRTGVRVRYYQQQAPGINEAVWGRFSQAKIIDGVDDDNDLKRRIRQDSIHQSKLGNQVGLGIRTGFLSPLDGYDICDVVPVHIVHGAIDTTRFGSGYWTILAVAWESSDDGNGVVTLTTSPREDLSAPSGDLLTLSPISTQAEWQIGWTPPDVSKVTSKYWLDQNTGIVYVRQTDGTYLAITDPANPQAPPVPPAPPASLTGGGVTWTDASGITLSGLVVTIPAQTDPSIRVTWVKITTNTLSPGVPDWTQAVIYPIAPGQTSITIPGVAAGVTYYIIAYSEDIFGNYSDFTAYAAVPMVKDVTAPNVPVGMAVAGALRGFVATWDTGVPPAGDLSFYEVRYCLGGSTSPSAIWTTARTKTNSIFQGGLNPDTNADGLADARYWVQVRSVDTTGNVLGAGSVTRDYLSYPEEGWCAAQSVDPTMVDGDMVQLASLNTTHISALDAGIITTGHLLIGTTRSDLFDGIKVYDGTTQVGWWDETGLYIYDVNNLNNYVQVYAGGITVYSGGVPTTAITPAGISATAITSGAIPGGGNIVVNSSFELASFQTPSSATWTDDVTADFNATVSGSNTNITVSNDIHITTAVLTY